MTKFYTGAFTFHGMSRDSDPRAAEIYSHKGRTDLIYYTYYEDGKKHHVKEKIKPYMFLEEKDLLHVNGFIEAERSFSSYDGKPLWRVDFKSIRDYKSQRRSDKDIMRFRTWYGSENWNYVFLNDHYPGEVNYDVTKLVIANIDIEVAADEGFPVIEDASKPVTAITMKVNDLIIVFGCDQFTTDREDIKYVLCEDENDLLQKFIQIFRNYDPDIITGWNVEYFDIPYLLYRIKNTLGFEYCTKLSPFDCIGIKKVGRDQNNKPIERPEIIGINVLDYLALYRKFTYVQQESYSLDNISFVHLGEKKLDYSEHDGLMSLYKNDYQKFIEYNIRDVELVDELDKHLGLLDLVYALAYDGKVNFSDTLTSVRMWDMIIHNHLYSKKIAIDPFVKKPKERLVEGAYVKDPQVGMHKWVVSFDLNSLYPHLIMQYNIGPDTYQGQVPGHLVKYVSVNSIIKGAYDTPEVKKYMKDHNVTICGSGAMYTRDFKGFLPEMMYKLYNDRSIIKDKMLKIKQEAEDSKEDRSSEIAKLDNMQMARKIQLNSVYGALGNEYFRWFDIKYAESITLSGQLSIKWMEKHINEYLNKMLETDNIDYVIACDTDSMYITLDRLVNKVFKDREVTQGDIVSWLDVAAREGFEPFIDKTFTNLAKMVNAYEQKMVMKREAIADKGMWTAKKRYALHVHSMESVRFSEPQLKIQGLETQRSSVPAICRSKMKEAIKLIMEKDEKSLIDFVEDFRNEFKNLQFEDVAFPRGVRGLNKYKSTDTIYGKGTPIHVRGALVFNHLLVEKNLLSKYNPVFEGDKIKFCYLTLPNPARENVIAAVNSLPRQLDIHPYIDYQMQFEKSFLEPMRTIAETIQWRLERGGATLEDFF